MTAEPQREFVDANVLVYAFDSSATSKQHAARRLLERLWESRSGCLSVQVLQEFFVTVTRKVASPLPVEEATSRVREFAAWRVFSPTADDVLAAIGLYARSNIAFWDAMIVLAALITLADIFEIIVVNDGSRDATGEIARRYPNAQVIDVPNGGLSAARNVGGESPTTIA